MKEILDGIKERFSNCSLFLEMPHPDVETLFNLIDSQAREYELMQTHKDEQIARLVGSVREALRWENMGRVRLILLEALKEFE
tara:strand:- start:79 stop:327 length:249 start_codon:yes stop_codon:yes gene_type:complete